MSQITDVLFRKWPDGQIIALFPGLAGNGSLDTCLSYEIIGQHGAADLDGVIADTKPATPEEYERLRWELEAAGYELAIKQRATRRHHRERFHQLYPA